MKKKVVFLFIFILIVFYETNQAKYMVEQTTLIAKINIDTLPPKIELMNITSIPYKEEKIYKINIQVKVTENNIKDNQFNKKIIDIKIGEKEVDKELYEINKVQEEENYIIYEIKIDKILIEGELKVIIPEGTIQDFANNKNEEKIIQNNF